LAGVVDKFLFIAPEVKKDFKLNQAEFQQMVVGEHMAINRKFKNSMTLIWKVPGMFAGNTIPGWMDHSCSVSRRVAMIRFKVKIKRVDQRLDSKLHDEMSAIILKGNQAYLTLCKEYGNKGIWENVPQYFKDTNEDLKSATHPIYSLFKSDKLEFGEDLYITEYMFRSILSRHCKETKMQEEPWNDDYYLVAFADRNLEMVRKTLPYPRDSDKMRDGFFIKGIDKARHLDQDNGGIQVHMPHNVRVNAQEPVRQVVDRDVQPFQRFRAVPTIVEDEI